MRLNFRLIYFWEDCLAVMLLYAYKIRLYMSAVRVSSLAILLMLPVFSQAEGGGDRVKERYEKMLEAQVAGRETPSKGDKSVAEQSELNTEKKC